MDRAEYLRSLAGLAKPLMDAPIEPGGGRTAYLARLTQIARTLEPSRGESPDTAEHAFRTVLLPNAKEMLWRIGGAIIHRRRALSERGRSALRALDASPDLLGPLRLERLEVAHSAAISFLLDPSASGSLGRACLSAFVDLLLRPDLEDDAPLPDQLDLGSAIVSAERDIGKYGRVDVSLESSAALLFVEVKVDAGEGVNQLDRYGEALEQLAGGRVTMLAFLTVREDQVSPTAFPHRHITFRDLLRAWLPVACSGVEGSTYLAMYLKTVATHLLGLAGAGAFDDWSLPTQRNAVLFIERELGS